MTRVLISVLVLGSAASARAQQPSGDLPGTMFISELSAGAAFGTGFSEDPSGVALRAAFGVGGAFRGFPPRFYLVGVARWARFDTATVRGFTSSDIVRDLWDLSAGLRVLVPLGRLRLLGELTLGDSIVSSSASLNGDRERYETGESRFTVYTALGLQYRVLRLLSVGLLCEWALPTSRDATDLVLDVSGVPDDGEMHGWTAVTGTVVLHF